MEIYGDTSWGWWLPVRIVMSPGLYVSVGYSLVSTYDVSSEEHLWFSEVWAVNSLNEFWWLRSDWGVLTDRLNSQPESNKYHFSNKLKTKIVNTIIYCISVSSLSFLPSCSIVRSVPLYKMMAFYGLNALWYKSQTKETWSFSVFLFFCSTSNQWAVS